VAGELLTRPASREVGSPPADLQAVNVAIRTSDSQVVRGWLVPGSPGDGVVLLLHGVRSDRRQMLQRARFLHSAGYTSLLIDLPAHGESSGDRITFGAHESVGVRASLAWLRGRFPRERIGVIGVSLGAAALVLARAQPQPDAVVVESMYPTIAEATRDRISIRLGAKAGSLLGPLLVSQLPVWTGVSQSDLRPVEIIGSLRSPLLVASGTRDRHTTRTETLRRFTAAGQPKRLWEVPGAAHVDLHRFAPRDYERVTLAFLDAHLRQPVASQ
jgi:alpha-beta hydrolase superfamily lysophospholipase